MKYVVYDYELNFPKSKSVISKKWFTKYFFENVPGPKSFLTGSAPKNKRDVLKKYHDVL